VYGRQADRSSSWTGRLGRVVGGLVALVLIGALLARPAEIGPRPHPVLAHGAHAALHHVHTPEAPDGCIDGATTRIPACAVSLCCLAILHARRPAEAPRPPTSFIAYGLATEALRGGIGIRPIPPPPRAETGQRVSARAYA
jgi:hypothetical protein